MGLWAETDADKVGLQQGATPVTETGECGEGAAGGGRGKTRGPVRDPPGQTEGSANRTPRNSLKNWGAEGNLGLGKAGCQPPPCSSCFFTGCFRPPYLVDRTALVEFWDRIATTSPP